MSIFRNQATHAGPIGLAVLAPLVLAVGVACSPAPPDRSPREIEQRLIGEEPPLFERTPFFKEEPTFAWSFADPAERENWVLRNVDEATPGKRGLEIQTHSDDPQLIREVDLNSKFVHVITAEVPNLRTGKITLFWAAEDESFSPERRIELATDQAKGKPAQFRFDVARHPKWRGTIARLRLDPTNTPGEPVRVQRMTGLRLRPEPEALASTLQQSFKVDLPPEARNAWLAVPGTAIERTVNLPPDARLSFGVALEPNVLEATNFRVEAFDPASGETRGTLFSREVDPAKGEAGSWHEAEVDLSGYAGEHLGLRFGTHSASAPDLARGFPAWSNPEIHEAAPSGRLPNIVLISLDTLRPDRLSAYGYARSTSPEIDAWAQESAVLFQNVVTQAPWTLPSHASLFSGIDSVRHGTNHYRGVPNSVDLLAEILRNAGYTTAAITGGGYLRPQFGFAQGFDRFRYWPEIMAAEELDTGLEDALAWLDENQGRRFFLFFHTYEIHYPHRRREPWFARLADPASLAQPKTDVQMREHKATPDGQWGGNYLVVRRPGSKEHVPGLTADEWKLVSSMYDSAVAYTDDAVGILLQRLHDLGLRGKTLIILTSDHGEALGENDLAGHNYLEDHNVLIPLLIEFPDQRGAGEAIEQQVRAVDVVPTVLELLGLPVSKSVQGQSLLPLVEDPEAPFPDEAFTYAASANAGFGIRQDNRLKYIYNDTAWASALGEEKLFDLESDPGESQNVASKNSEQAARLREQARQWLDAQHQGWRLRIRNDEADWTLKGRLTGAWRSRNKVKAIAEDCACIHWAPGRAAEFALAPGQEITLYFAPLDGTTAGLKGSLEDRNGIPVARFSRSFDLSGATNPPLLLEYSAAGWQSEEQGPSAPATPKTGFVAFSVGDIAASAERSIPKDPAIEAQLRALGYVQ